MVYRRKTTFKRKYNSKKPFKPSQWYQKKYSVGDMASSAWKATKYLASMINSEVMKKDTSLTLGSQQSTIAQLNAIAQDDTISGRTGNSILCKNLTLKGSMQINSSVTQNTRIALILILDTQQTADTNPTLSDIFTSTTDPHTLLNVNSTGRYKIIKRWNYWLTPASGGKPVAQLDYFKEFKMLHT